MSTTTQSVSELTRAIKDELESIFPFVRVRGEISNCKLHSSGHVYLTLKDAEAQLPAVIWKSVRSRFPIDLRDGMEVIAEGRLEVYPPAGRYQLICTSVAGAGEGLLQQELARLMAKLAKAGYFNPERKRPVPRIPRTIGLITSPTGAVIKDMSDVFSRRFPAAALLLYPVQVQGERAVESIMRAFEYFNDPGMPSDRKPDVLILARGGGSAEDLQAFNSEEVAGAIYRSTIPVISAIGHETDLSIADMVADLRAGTPSIAAERAAPDRDELLRHIDSLASRQTILMNGKISGAQLQVDSICGSYAFNRPVLMLGQMEERLAALEKQIGKGVADKLGQRELVAAAATERLRAMDVRRILERGFAIVTENGRYVTSASSVAHGAEVRIDFRDGSREAVVTDGTGS